MTGCHGKDSDMVSRRFRSLSLDVQTTENYLSTNWKYLKLDSICRLVRAKKTLEKGKQYRRRETIII